MVLQKSNKLKQMTKAWLPECLNPADRGVTVVGQLGQSLDGQIATATGQSKYINGASGLLHLHKLRAWADVVLVGVGTVVADNPQLTVRLVQGDHPVRLVIDPAGRVPTDARLLVQDDVDKYVVTRPGVTLGPVGPRVRQVPLPADAAGGLNPVDILGWIARMGWSRVLLEGGPSTLGRFLAAGCVDYLHLITSALLLGAGTPGLSTPAVVSLGDARRFKARPYVLGEDLLIECDLR